MFPQSLHVILNIKKIKSHVFKNRYCGKNDHTPSKRIEEQDLLNEVYRILSENEKQREEIVSVLTNKSLPSQNRFEIDQLDATRILHISDIEQICVSYRLRFLNSNFFKGKFPAEAISEICYLENEYQHYFGKFKNNGARKIIET